MLCPKKGNQYLTQTIWQWRTLMCELWRHCEGVNHVSSVNSFRVSSGSQGWKGASQVLTIINRSIWHEISKTGPFICFFVLCGAKTFYSFPSLIHRLLINKTLLPVKHNLHVHVESSACEEVNSRSVGLLSVQKLNWFNVPALKTPKSVPDWPTGTVKPTSSVASAERRHFLYPSFHTCHK